MYREFFCHFAFALHYNALSIQQKLIVSLTQILTDKCNIILDSVSVNILRNEFPIIMCKATLTLTERNSLFFHNSPHFIFTMGKHKPSRLIDESDGSVLAIRRLKEPCFTKGYAICNAIVLVTGNSSSITNTGAL